MEYGVVCHTERDPGPENALNNEWINQWEPFEIALMTDFGIHFISICWLYITTIDIIDRFVISTHTWLIFWQQDSRPVEAIANSNEIPN